MITEFKGENDFMSNFHFHDGWCVEVLFQAMKATTTEDQEYVQAVNDPREAKKRGHEIKLREDWEVIKVPTMLALLRLKFKIPEMERKLLDTGHLELIEGNWWHDNEWGDCTCGKCSLIRGRNLLGQLLMHVRKEIVLNMAFGKEGSEWQTLPFEEK
jgi:ribA/ribD-fused uncharacterized protein